MSRRVLAILLIVLMLSEVAHAADTWIRSMGNPGLWTDGGNWYSGQVPGATSTARITNGGTAIVESEVFVGPLYLGNYLQSGGHLIVDGGILNASVLKTETGGARSSVTLLSGEIRASVSITSSNTSPSTFDHYDGILIGQLGVWRYCHYDFHSGLIQTSETSIAGSMLQRGGVHEAGLMYVNGNYEMNAGSLNSGNLILAKTNYDNGYFYQNGGSVVAADVIVGNAGSSYYRLNGDLDCAYLAVNSNSTFDQVAGRTTVAGDVLVTSSTFNLLAGSINGQSLSLRTGAWFRQQDGTATFAGDLTLNRGHVVIDAGSLTAGKAVMGIASDTYTSTFRQNGGLTSFSSLFIDKTAIYTADGGELRVDNGLAIDGRLDVGTSAEFRLHVGSGLVDLAGQVTNLHRLSYSAGAGSITILPAGFSAGDFASCQVEGIIVQAGQLLSIGPNQPLALAGTIRTPVETRSDITAAAGRSLTFAEGLYIDNATVQTGVGGMVQARNATSGINGGLLTTSSLRTTDSGSVFTVDGGHVETQYITVGSGSKLIVNDGTVSMVNYSGGNNVTVYGQFVQNGGIIENANVRLMGSTSRFEMYGGTLNAQGAALGGSASNVWIQTAGDVTMSSLSIGNPSSGGLGRAELSGGTITVSDLTIASTEATAYHQTAGTLATRNFNNWGNTLIAGGDVTTEYLYIRPPASFTQTGGTVTVTERLFGYLGYYYPGRYLLSGGQLSVKELRIDDNYLFTFGLTGSDWAADIQTLKLGNKSTLQTTVTEGGLATIYVDGNATLSGLWTVVDCDAAFGRWNVLEVGGELTLSFSGVHLPGEDWRWGREGQALWVEHVPEPMSSVLLAAGLAWLYRRRVK